MRYTWVAGFAVVVVVFGAAVVVVGAAVVVGAYKKLELVAFQKLNWVFQPES